MPNKSSHRMDKVNSELQREISQVINYELKNANITGIISVTRVKTTPDLRYAKVYVSVIGSKNLKKTLDGLKSAKTFIRGRVASTVNLRITPELVFEYDDSDIQGGRIDSILAEIKRKDEIIKQNPNHREDDEEFEDIDDEDFEDEE